MNNLNRNIFKFIIRTRNPAISQRNLNVGVKPTRRENLLYKAKNQIARTKDPVSSRQKYKTDAFIFETGR